MGLFSKNPEKQAKNEAGISQGVEVISDGLQYHVEFYCKFYSKFLFYCNSFLVNRVNIKSTNPSLLQPVLERLSSILCKRYMYICP